MTFRIFFLSLYFHCTCGLNDHEYKTVITVDFNDSSSNKDCCKLPVFHSCHFSSLERALSCITDNTLINITSPIVPLSSLVNITGRTTIGISGNDGTVISCNNTGGVSFINCKNIDISGVIWDQCGGSGLTGAVSMVQSSDISIDSCVFHNSTAYGVIFLSASGIVIIYNNLFLYNPGNSSSTRGGGLLFKQLQQRSNALVSFDFKLTISNCTFRNNTISSFFFNKIPINCGLCILVNDSSVVSFISIENTTFMDDWTNGRGFYVNVAVHNITLQLAGLHYDYKYKDFVGHMCRTFLFMHQCIQFVTENEMRIHLNATNVMLFVENSTIKNVNMDVVVHSKCAFVNFKTSLLHGTIAALKVNNEDIGILRFNRLLGNDSSLKISGSKHHGFQVHITSCQFCNYSDVNPVLDISNIYALHPQLNIIYISNSTFCNVTNGVSAVHIAYIDSSFGEVHMSSTYFANNFNNDQTLVLYNCKLVVKHNIVFFNNAATKGGGIYFTGDSFAILSNNSRIEFINNIALEAGGAIYADFTSNPWLLFYVNGSYSATFYNNYANTVGNSIFFNISSDIVNRDPFDENSIVYIPRHFNYSSSDNQIATSPYSISLGSAATCISKSCDQGGVYAIKGIMLGEELFNSAMVTGYFNETSEAGLFHIECVDCGNYELNSISGSFIYIGMAKGVSIVGEEIKSDIVLSMQLSSIRGVISKLPQIKVMIKLHLSPCHVGYKYDGTQKMCVCSDFNGIVLCSNTVRIKRGYWYGTVNGKRAVTHCPNNYCDYRVCPVGSEFCNVSNFECSSHRRGIACGTCIENYTLPFDSDKCIPIDRCEIDRIIVIIVTILCWIITIFVIRFLMYFITVEPITGYLYGIIFFYSVLEFIIGEDLVVSDGLKLFITILSSIVNLSPKFLGQLCLAIGLSGIDQEVIHCVHPIAVVLLLLIIARAANRSVRFTAFVRQRGVVRTICLLLLLFYTSLSSTSWLLLRPLTFNGADGVYTYLSPDIKYFSGRHVAYSLIAIFCGIVIVLGLPILLLSEPILRRKFTFIKVKPLLDQFQGCYKAKYHCFAAFYLVYRLLMLLVISLDINYRYLILQILCLIFAIVHAWVQPYKNNGLNSLDLSILLIMLMIVSLNVGATYSVLLGSIAANELILAVLIMLPLIMFVTLLLYSSNLCKDFIMCRAAHGYVHLQR